MGINQCAKGTVLWEATGLSLHSLKILGLENRIDIDGNFLFYKIRGSTRKSVEDITIEMALLLKKIAHSGGFIVTVIMDGDSRPDCKRASWEQRKEVSLEKTNRLYCRLKVLEMSSRLEKEKLTEDERKKMETELKAYNQAAKSFENKSGKANIPPHFSKLLLRRLISNGATKMNERDGFVSPKIIKAKFQADYVISLQSLENKNDFIYSTDTDFCALLGNDCILIAKVQENSSVIIKNDKRKKKNGKQDNIKKQNNNGKEIGKDKKNDMADDDAQSMVLDATAFDVTLAGVSNEKMKQLQKCFGNKNKNHRQLKKNHHLEVCKDANI